MEDTNNILKFTLAGKKIKVRYLYNTICRLCRDYIADFDDPDIEIIIKKDELYESMPGMPELRIDKTKTVATYEEDYLETVMVLRKTADALAEYGMLLMHGAAVAVNNKCFVFLADSGVGKTTHAMNWLKMIPGAFIVNGDKPFIDIRNDLVYGSPWGGKESMHKNTCVPLGGLVILDRGEENIIKRTGFREILPCIFRQTYIPKDSSSSKLIYEMIMQFGRIPCYHLFCNMDAESAVVSYNGIMQN